MRLIHVNGKLTNPIILSEAAVGGGEDFSVSTDVSQIFPHYYVQDGYGNGMCRGCIDGDDLLLDAESGITTAMRRLKYNPATKQYELLHPELGVDDPANILQLYSPAQLILGLINGVIWTMYWEGYESLKQPPIISRYRLDDLTLLSSISLEDVWPVGDNVQFLPVSSYWGNDRLALIATLSKSLDDDENQVYEYNFWVYDSQTGNLHELSAPEPFTDVFWTSSESNHMREGLITPNWDWFGGRFTANGDSLLFFSGVYEPEFIYRYNIDPTTGAPTFVSKVCVFDLIDDLPEPVPGEDYMLSMEPKYISKYGDILVYLIVDWGDAETGDYIESWEDLPPSHLYIFKWNSVSNSYVNQVKISITELDNDLPESVFAGFTMHIGTDSDENIYMVYDTRNDDDGTVKEPMKLIVWRRCEDYLIAHKDVPKLVNRELYSPRLGKPMTDGYIAYFNDGDSIIQCDNRLIIWCVEGSSYEGKGSLVIWDIGGD